MTLKFTVHVVQSFIKEYRKSDICFLVSMDVCMCMCLYVHMYVILGYNRTDVMSLSNVNQSSLPAVGALLCIVVYEAGSWY